MEDADVDALRLAGWTERSIWEATALIAFFNFSGRVEAASGLPHDQLAAVRHPPVGARPTHASPVKALLRSSRSPP